MLFLCPESFFIKNPNSRGNPLISMNLFQSESFWLSAKSSVFTIKDLKFFCFLYKIISNSNPLWLSNNSFPWGNRSWVFRSKNISPASSSSSSLSTDLVLNEARLMSTFPISLSNSFSSSFEGWSIKRSPLWCCSSSRSLNSSSKSLTRSSIKE